MKDRLPDDEQEVLVIAHGWDGRLVYVGSHKRVEAQKSWLTGITNESSELLEYTNIETSLDEMKVIDTFLFRCWQMGWLECIEVSENG